MVFSGFIGNYFLKIFLTTSIQNRIFTFQRGFHPPYKFSSNTQEADAITSQLSVPSKTVHMRGETAHQRWGILSSTSLLPQLQEADAIASQLGVPSKTVRMHGETAQQRWGVIASASPKSN
ncbi:hypothetical protein H8K35_13235 [Undibacterium sp. LX40W]|uniref:Uncharacterized protein n=1 Tax=Undibacterium nitidum TaxID=2762298 RepID=A0A923HTL3_9BURK|nr:MULTISPECIES: hypothetical protein [Undibacterium]MBC3882352.1 hypothetical protein [Undibacterium nitidum]MBC3892633.1 hypothetical protein [Undibacterium sp. LX40W]